MFWKNKERPNANKSPSAFKGHCPSIITKDLHILGNIICDGAIDFDGTIDGNIRCESLTIRENGNVKGEITADTVLIYGKVNGLIRSKHAHLFSSCHIEGIVMHESIKIEDGAFIDGKCKRTNKVLEIKDHDEDEEGSGIELPKIMENIRLIR